MDSADLRRAWVRVRRHLRWARRDGVARLVEEDQLDPRARAKLRADRERWLSEHPGIAPNAMPVFLVGVQRSGTNMLVRGLETSPSFDVCNENDKRAFVRFRLRPVRELRSLVQSNGHRAVLFKPLAESHRIVELLDTLGTPTPPKAIWAYRAVDGRVRSAVTKFGPNNLLALRAIAEDRHDRDWSVDGPAQEIVDTIRDGLSPENTELVRSFDYDRLDAEAGAALFWYVRNSLYFELGLHRRDDVMISSYERIVTEPEPTMRTLCRFLGVPFTDDLIAHVDTRSATPPRLTLPDEIRRRCDDLEIRLGAAADEQAVRLRASVLEVPVDRAPAPE
jgi:hypothetical protein